MEFEMELNLENDELNVELGITETLKGKDGADGKNGADGKDGIDGKDGLSAYEIATKNGFEGSEEEWLDSLKGADGKSYDDTELINRVSTLESTVGTLNDSLEEVLSGNGD